MANASACAAASGGDEPIGSPKTANPPAIVVTFVAAVMSAITVTGRPVCSPRWNAKNAPARRQRGDRQPRRRRDRRDAGQRLDAEIGGAVEQPARDPQRRRARRPAPGAGESGGTPDEHRDPGREHERVRVAVPPSAQPEGEQHERDDHQRRPPPLAHRDAMPEPERGHRHSQREPAGDERLHQRQRRPRQRADVHCPAEEPERRAGEPGGRGQERPERLDRMPRRDRRRAARRAGVLQQVRSVQRHRCRERESDADPQRAAHLAFRFRSYRRRLRWPSP